jgi:UDP-4-amino-4-deoxy-L-arabinose formyltransferase/UDP-glucuronic acid dehydrogenase (UDP-4-keto-hexauronic acid decarboxylating)
MKIAIIGRTQFLYDTALKLRDAGHDLQTVVTAKVSPEYTRTEDDFKGLAESVGVPFFLTNTLNDTAVTASLQGLDIGVSVNWVSIVRKEHIDLFEVGILNAHMGDLPRYRGNACPNWAILNGEEFVTLSVHLMQEDLLDCGRIIAQDKYPLNEDTYIFDIYEWAQEAMPMLFVEAAGLLQKDSAYTLKYADPDSPESFRCYPRRPEDGCIDWHMSAVDIHRLIRASAEPFPGAFASLDGEKVIIWRAELFDDGEKYCAVVGQVSDVNRDDGSVVLITGDGKIKLTEIEYKGVRGRPSEVIKSVRKRLE